MTTTAPAGRRARRAAAAVGGSRQARAAARAGLAARSLFYLLLAGLVAEVAVAGGTGGRQAGGHQVNANGALTVIAANPAGMAAIAAAALGFFSLGAVRLAGAVRDRDAEGLQRLLTAVQGVFYLALTWVPLSFVLGHRGTGSEGAQHAETATVLAWPAGRVLVVAAGLVVIGVCAYQVRTALRQDFTDGLDLTRAPRWVCRLVEAAGTVGIAARALVFLPVGVFLIVAAVQADPQHAKGLDAELAAVARRGWWGSVLLGVVVLGLVVFAVYGMLEARYRRVGRSA